MFCRDIEDKYKKLCKEYLDKNNITSWNKNYEDAIVNVYGFMVVYEIIVRSLPKIEQIQMGGSFVNEGVTYSVHSIARKSTMSLDFATNYSPKFKNNAVDILIFCTFIKTENSLTICGMYPRQLYYDECKKCKKGDTYYAGNQKRKYLRDNWEMIVKKIHQVNNPEDMQRRTKTYAMGFVPKMEQMSLEMF